MGNPTGELNQLVGKFQADVSWTHNLILCGDCGVALQHLMFCFCKNKIDIVGVDQKIVLSKELLAVEIDE